MKGMILAQGWIFSYNCNCGGSLREHYYHPSFPGYEVRIRPTKLTFSILNQGMMVAGPDWGYKMETKMKQLGLCP